MRTTDFHVFDQAVDNVSVLELDQLARTQEYDEGFLAFFRYVEILDHSDPKKQHSQLLIEQIKQIPKFKAYLDQTLKVLDNDSVIQEEDQHPAVVDEVPTQRIMMQSAPIKSASKTQIKEINIEILWNAIMNKNSAEAIEFLQQYKLSDLLFFRGSPQYAITIDRLLENNKDFQPVEILQSTFNIL